MEQIKIAVPKPVARQSSFDSNNNDILEIRSDSGTNDRLSSATTVGGNRFVAEAINGRLVERRHSTHSDISSGINECAVGEPVNDTDVICDGDFDALENSSDGNSENGEEFQEKKQIDEPYDADKVLISTFLEHTNSIVRKYSYKFHFALIFICPKLFHHISLTRHCFLGRGPTSCSKTSPR